MKRIYTLMLFLLISLMVFGQAPQAFKFQTVIRNGDGEVLSTQNLSLKFLIHIGSTEGEVIFSELHHVITNSFGLVDVNIGTGEAITGSFVSIMWGKNSYFLEEQIDMNNTGAFLPYGTVQMLSVPYSLHANTTNGLQSMTTEERNAIADPPVGMQIYNIETQCLNYFTGNHWFEACGHCTPQPTEANAGEDQIGIQQNWVILQGNQPLLGIGHWSIMSGEDGHLVENNNPNSIFYGQFNSDYTLQWNIENECGVSTDQVLIAFDVDGFNCGDTLYDIRDQQKYGTVAMGNQCWMAQNLNFGIYIAGVNDMLNNGIYEKYCYNDYESNCEIYGGLYQWDEMMQYSTVAGLQGICPFGWHIPTDTEWSGLSTYVNGQSVFRCNNVSNYIAKALASKTFWYVSPITCSPGNNLSANNATGFSGLPSGFRNQEGVFINSGTHTLWWSSNEYEEEDAWDRYLLSIYQELNRSNSDKIWGISVRCLKNN